MALAAGQQISPSQPMMMTEVEIQRGLILPEDTEVTVQTIVTPQVSGTYQFEIFSLTQDLDVSDQDAPSIQTNPSGISQLSAQSAPRWISHAKGVLRPLDCYILPSQIDLEACKADFPRSLSIPDYYQQLRQWGLAYGDLFQAIHRLWVKPQEALAEIHLSEALIRNPSVYQLHPILLDGSFQMLAAAIGAAQTQETYLPAGVAQLQILQPIPGKVWAIGSIESPEDSHPHTLTAEVRLYDATGSLVAQVEGLTLARANRQALMRYLQPKISPTLYEINWSLAPHPHPVESSQVALTQIQTTQVELPPVESTQLELVTLTQIEPTLVESTQLESNPPETSQVESANPGPNQPTDPLTKTWLLFSQPTGLGAQLANLLQQQGQICIFVSPGSTYQPLDTRHYLLDPTHPKDFQQLLQDVLTPSICLQGIVHLWGSLSTATTPPQTVQDTQALTCASVLHLVQALTQYQGQMPPLSPTDWQTQSQAPTAPTLWLVTQGAQRLESDTHPIQFHQTPLWGLGRVLALEHPELACRCVDLTPSSNPEDPSSSSLKNLVQELLAPETENQIAYRQGNRYIARLATHPFPVHPSPCLPIPLSSPHPIPPILKT